MVVPDSPISVRQRIAAALFAILLCVVPAGLATGQDDPKITARYQIENGTRKGWLIVTVEIPEKSHIYSVTQEGNPPPTRLELAESRVFRVLAGITADKKPHVVENDPLFNQRVETYEQGVVNLLLPIEIADGQPLETVPFDLKFNGQICSESGCKPLFNKPLAVAWGGFYDPPPQDPAGQGAGNGGEPGSDK